MQVQIDYDKLYAHVLRSLGAVSDAKEDAEGAAKMYVEMVKYAIANGGKVTSVAGGCSVDMSDDLRDKFLVEYAQKLEESEGAAQ